MTKTRYLFEAVGLTVLMAVFKLMPVDCASATGGWLGRTIGPRLAASRKALRHVERALPETTPEERRRIVTGMWDNLGRVMAEYPHLDKIGRDRVVFENHPAFEKLLNDQQPCIMLGGHLANWEAGGVAMLHVLKTPVDLTYRAPNNPWADRLLMRARTLNGKIRAYSKSRAGGQEMLKALRAGRYLGFLVDQKYNEGLAVPFFDHPAMTNPVFVQLSRKFSYPLVPWQIERLRGARFKITIFEPIIVGERTTEDVIAIAHEHLENWIRKNPAQWLWLHRRWDSQKLKEMEEAA